MLSSILSSGYFIYCIYKGDNYFIYSLFDINYKINNINSSKISSDRKNNFFSKRILLIGEIALLLTGSIGGIWKFSDYGSFLKNDQKHRLDYTRWTRGNNAVEPKIIKLIPGYFPERLECITHPEGGKTEYFKIDSMGITPSERQLETSTIPDSTTTKNTFLRKFFRLPNIDEYIIGGQPREGYCVVWSTKKVIEFSVNKIIPECDVVMGINYNDDKDGSPNLPAIVDYINKNVNDSGLKAEYFLNPQMHDVIDIILSGGKVMADINSKSGYPHRVVGYDVEKDDDGKIYIIIHDSGKTYFDKDGRYVKTAAESRKVYEKYVSGSKRRIPIEIFQDMMNAGLTGNSLGSAVRWATGVNSVGIAVYNPNCFNEEYLEELFSFSRSSMNQVFKNGVNVYTRGREHPNGAVAIELLFILSLLLRIGSLGIRTYKAVKGNRSSDVSNFSPEETTQ